MKYKVKKGTIREDVKKKKKNSKNNNIINSCYR